MKRHNISTLGVVVICLIVLVIAVNVFKLDFFLRAGFEKLFLPIATKFRLLSVSSEVTRLQEENRKLLKRVATFEEMKRENNALRDQFQTTFPKSTNLLPAKIVGSIGFIPGVSLPEYFILDKGEKDGVKKGQAVLITDVVVGLVEKTSSQLSFVWPIYHRELQLQGKTEKGVNGIIKGEGSIVVLENVLIADTLSKGDIVVTVGEVKGEGNDILPNLVIGRIESIDKKPSSLFQTANIKSPVDFSKLETVFILIHPT